LGANATLTGQLIVAIVLHISFGSIHLHYLKSPKRNVESDITCSLKPHLSCLPLQHTPA